MSPAPHVIQRQHLRLRLPADVDGRAVQQQATTALQSRPLLDALAAALSAANPTDAWLNLERLEIHLGHLDSAKLPQQLLERLPDLLRYEVAEALAAARGGASASATELSSASTAWSAWFYFLEHGTLPAHWPAPVSMAEWEMELRAQLAVPTAGQLVRLRAALLVASSRLRLVRQFSVALVAAVLAALDGSARPYTGALTQALEPLLRPHGSYSGRPGERLLLELLRRVSQPAPPDWFRLLDVLTPAQPPHTPQALTQLARAALAVVRTSAPPEEHEPEPAVTSAEAEAQNNAEYVLNAGVVLLHPFLPQCFAACGWLKGDDFVSEKARIRAVLLVHYLATGATQAPEYELRVTKLLCGMPASAAPNRRLRLSRYAQAEGLVLLNASLEHWASLKNTSPNGLREAFLQREGKLERDADGHYFLTVEQRAQDVLLDRLPYGWGLGVVQLPWMPTRLSINWV